MRRQQGVALISVLLLLSAMLVMAVAMQLLALLGALATRNQLAFAAAEAELHSRLTHSLLLLEGQLGPAGEMPAVPLLPAGTDYQLIGPKQARLQLANPQPPQLAREVVVEVNAGRIAVIQVR